MFLFLEPRLTLIETLACANTTPFDPTALYQLSRSPAPEASMVVGPEVAFERRVQP